MYTHLGCALYCGLWMAQVNTPTLCKHVMTDGYTPASTSKGNVYKWFKNCTKVLVISGINNTIRYTWWAGHLIHMHHYLSTCHYDSADNTSPKVKHTNFLWREWWWTGVPDWGFSSWMKFWDDATLVLRQSQSSYREITSYTQEHKWYPQQMVINVWWDDDRVAIHSRVLQQEFGHIINGTPLRWQCMGHSKLFLMEGIKMALLISKTDVSPVWGLSNATAASTVVMFSCLDL